MVRDPVHGVIELSVLERLLLNSPVLQRLRRVRQLGTAYLAYPGAVHTRLSHVIGVLATAQQLLDGMRAAALRRGTFPNLFAQWHEDGPDAFRLRFAEVRIAARLAAMLHDLGHIPIGHSLEDIYRILPAHDADSARIGLLWSQLAEWLDTEAQLGVITGPQRDALQTLIDGDLFRELLPMIVAKAGLGDPPRYPWLAALVGDTLCADLLDYVQRDHLFCGLPFMLDDHALRALTVTNAHATYPSRMAIRTVRHGRERPEVSLSMIDLLHARHRIYSSVNSHHVVIISAAMIAKAIEATLAHERDTLQGDSAALKRIERVLLTFGDDELLRHLSTRGRSERLGSAWTDPRLFAAGELAQSVLDRALFTTTASCTGRRFADRICDRFATSAARSRLELDLAQTVDVNPYHIILWIAPHGMWAKNLEHALIAEDNQLTPVLQSSWGARAIEIAEAHRDSWRAHLIVHRSVPHDKREQLRTELARRTNTNWHRSTSSS